MNTLIQKLQGTADNNILEKVGELRIYNKGNNPVTSSMIDVRGETTIEYVSNYVSIFDKYQITSLILRPDLLVKIEKLQYCTSLTFLNVNTTDVVDFENFNLLPITLTEFRSIRMDNVSLLTQLVNVTKFQGTRIGGVFEDFIKGQISNGRNAATITYSFTTNNTYFNNVKNGFKNIEWSTNDNIVYSVALTLKSDSSIISATYNKNTDTWTYSS